MGNTPNVLTVHLGQNAVEVKIQDGDIVIQSSKEERSTMEAVVEMVRSGIESTRSNPHLHWRLIREGIALTGDTERNRLELAFMILDETSFTAKIGLDKLAGAGPHAHA